MGRKYIFDPSILDTVGVSELLEDSIEKNQYKCKFQDLTVRPLSNADYGKLYTFQLILYFYTQYHDNYYNNKDYVSLLSQLTDVGQIGEEEFRENFQKMFDCPNTYFVVVIQNLINGCLVGAATLFVENKFIHSCSKRGHIEDVIVDSEFRGLKLGHILVTTLVRLGKHMGCYKISLDCKDEKVAFYEKMGFKCTNNFMSIRFDG